MIWKWLENKKPVCIALKTRKEGDITVACSSKLEVFYLNITASFLVNMADGRITLSEIAKIMIENFEVSEPDLINDLVEVIRQLQWKRIIKLND
ncbi:PqqD family protein [Succinimonas sp.]|uniref:PqqD family protein n=1 Tax=Succinimonas sp. TaxID=1936151 RepID=UPI00386B9755